MALTLDGVCVQPKLQFLLLGKLESSFSEGLSSLYVTSHCEISLLLLQLSMEGVPLAF